MLIEMLTARAGLTASAARTVEMLLIFALVFALTVLLTKIILPVLRRKKLGQNISGYVEEHKSKQGTPTMGGICFILATLIVLAVWFIFESRDEYRAKRELVVMALTLCLGVANGMIGFVDDYAKLVKKRNEGLTPTQKSLLQFVVAAAYLCVMSYTGNLSLALRIPFTDIMLDLGWFAYPIYLLVIVGFVNSTNITDGLDGLASSIALSVAGALMLTSAMLGWRYTGIISGALAGAVLGFLVFNHYPAKIFMGDTGSLFLGGIIMGCAFSEGELLNVVIISLVFICEMLSSLLQTLYFKLTHGKRLFKMAPVHHHFQKMGWSEIKIVTVFFLVSIVFCALGVLGTVMKF